MSESREPKKEGLASNHLVDASKENRAATESEIVRNSDELGSFVAENEATVSDPELECFRAAPVEVEDAYAGLLVSGASGSKKLRFWDRLFAREFVGLDIGSGSVKFVRLRKSGERIKILEYRIETFSGMERTEDFEIASRIRALLGKKGLRSPNIITTISGPSLNVRVIKMPRVSKKQIREALLWRNKKELHFFNDAPTMLDYLAIDEDAGAGSREFNILVLAVKEELVKRHIGILSKSGIVPQKVVAKPIATWNSYLNSPDRMDEEVLIDMGHDSTSLCFFHQGKLNFARELTIGANHFTLALMETIFSEKQTFSLSWDEAERIKRSHGLLSGNTGGFSSEGVPLNEISSRLRPIAEKLVSEINLSVSYYRENLGVEKTDRVLLTGNGIRIPNLKIYLEQNLGLPIELFNPISGATLGDDCRSDPELLSGAAVAFGSALSSGPYMNYAPPELKIQVKYTRYLALFGKAAALLVLILFHVAAFLIWEKEMKKEAVRLTEENLRMILPKTKEYEDLVQKQAEFRAQEKALRSEMVIGHSVLDQMKIISSVVPEEIVLDEIRYGDVVQTDRTGDVKDKKLRSETKSRPENDPLRNVFVIKGKTYKNLFYGDVHLIDFLASLERTGYFSNVELNEKKREPGTDQLNFQIICRR